MDSYQIVCTELEYPTQHRHIVAVGTGDLQDRATQRWTVAEVRASIAALNYFYTTSPTTGDVGLVRASDCGCGYKTIRSVADRDADNNLGNLRACRWPS